METIIAHEVEPGLLIPPPRPARLSGSTEFLLALSGLLALLLLVGGARALLEAGRLAWAAAAGRHVEAHLISIQTAPGPDKAPVQVGVRYQYADPYTGQTVSRYALVDRGEGDLSMPGMGTPTPRPRRAPLRVGQPLVLHIIGRPGHEHIYFWSASPLAKGLFVALCGGAVIAVSLRLMLILTRWRSTRTRLLRWGHAVVGTIVHKHTDFGDTPRYFLRYGYATADAREPREHEEQVNPDQWKRFEIGQPVTVLYDPEATDCAALFALLR